jgi:hypothetical protein
MFTVKRSSRLVKSIHSCAEAAVEMSTHMSAAGISRTTGISKPPGWKSILSGKSKSVKEMRRYNPRIVRRDDVD